MSSNKEFEKIMENYINLIPDHLKTDEKICASVKEYMLSFSDKEILSFMIARDHLQSSFNILMSNGYKEWLQQRKEN
jgi:hypothetical protein